MQGLYEETIEELNFLKPRFKTTHEDVAIKVCRMLLTVSESFSEDEDSDHINRLLRIPPVRTRDILGFYLGFHDAIGGLASLFSYYFEENRKKGFEAYSLFSQTSVHPKLLLGEEGQWTGSQEQCANLSKVLKNMTKDLDLDIRHNNGKNALVPIFYLYSIIEYSASGKLSTKIESNSKWKGEL